MADLLTRIRQCLATEKLAPGLEQLLQDMAAHLVREAAPPRLAFSDSSFIPGAETRGPLLSAALDHVQASGGVAFLELVPDTRPQLVVCMGEPLEIINILADNYGER